MKNKGSSTLGLILKILLLLIALVYFVLLIAGKWIFSENSFFYVSINIFSKQENVSVWLRSLAYIIFFLTLSYVIRLFLKLLARNLNRGKAMLDLLSSFIKYIAVIAMLFFILHVWGVDTAALLAGIGILSLVVGLGAQPLIEDIIAGLFIVFENVFETPAAISKLSIIRIYVRS